MASDSLKLYALIYVALVGLAASKFIFFEFDFFTYEQAFAGTMTAAALKTTLIAGYYQHLRWERRSLAGLMLTGLLLVALLMTAASYSIT